MPPGDHGADPVARVQLALDQLLPGTRVLRFDDRTHTAAAAAAAVGCSLGAIVKSLLFLVDGAPLLVLTAGDRQVSDAKLAARAGVSRKRVKMADAATVAALTGSAPGGVSPVGHPHPLPALLDQSLARFELLYAAAGADDTVFPVTWTDLQAITGGEPADLTRDAP